MDKYGFVYIWRDRKRNKYYIGCHWGTIEDGYVCSSKWMRNAYKNRKTDFKRRILSTHQDRQTMIDEEYRLLQLIKKPELGKRYYNLNQTKVLQWSNLEYRKRISEFQSARNKGTKYWINSTGQIRQSKQCPGEGWIRKLKIVKRDKQGSRAHRDRVRLIGLKNKGRKWSKEERELHVNRHTKSKRTIITQLIQVMIDKSYNEQLNTVLTHFPGMKPQTAKSYIVVIRKKLRNE